MYFSTLFWLSNFQSCILLKSFVAYSHSFSTVWSHCIHPYNCTRCAYCRWCAFRKTWQTCWGEL